MKLARLPLKHDLDSYDYRFESAMSAIQLRQLRELNRLDQCYNIMLKRFFVFINRIYETTSFIITTNKSPAERAKSPDDETLATAILDRLLYKCQLIQFHGPS